MTVNQTIEEAQSPVNCSLATNLSDNTPCRMEAFRLEPIST